jgi:hypothetical protein
MSLLMDKVKDMAADTVSADQAVIFDFCVSICPLVVLCLCALLCSGPQLVSESLGGSEMAPESTETTYTTYLTRLEGSLVTPFRMTHSLGTLGRSAVALFARYAMLRLFFSSARTRLVRVYRSDAQGSVD